jgi:hypothetical protein
MVNDRCNLLGLGLGLLHPQERGRAQAMTVPIRRSGHASDDSPGQGHCEDEGGGLHFTVVGEGGSPEVADDGGTLGSGGEAPQWLELQRPAREVMHEA